MKNIHSHTRQSGFFSAGLGLGLLLIFGSLSSGIATNENNDTENLNQQQVSQQTEGKKASLETLTLLEE